MLGQCAAWSEIILYEVYGLHREKLLVLCRTTEYASPALAVHNFAPLQGIGRRVGKSRSELLLKTDE